MDRIGQLVTSKAGRDQGTVYVVVAQEGDFLYLSDGRLKPPDHPKKKRLRHVQPIDSYVGGGLLDRLQRGGKVYAEEVRYALKQYGMSENAARQSEKEPAAISK